jgi:uncharacterized membrane protein
MNNKIKILSLLGIFTMIFAAVFTIASPICATTLCGSVIDPISEASHNTDLTINFNVTYEGSQSSTTLSFTNSNTNIGSWKILPPSTTSINKGETKQFQGVLTIPENANGAINAKILVKTSSGSESEITIPPIKIREEPLLTISPETQRITDNVEINLENKGNVAFTNIGLTQSGPFQVSFSTNNFALSTGESRKLTISTLDLTGLKFGINEVTITAKDRINGAEDSILVTHTKSFCKSGEAGGNLEITNVDINSDGDEDDESKPLNTVEVEVEVENLNDDDDIDDVFIELGLFDSAGKNQARDLDFENTDEEEIDLGKIRDGEEETATFKFKLPGDFEEGSYKLAIKAYSDDLKEVNECTDTSDDFDDEFFQSISVDREDDEGKFIAFDNIEVRPDQLTCGESATLTLDVYNIGDEDQDQIRVNLFSSDLNLDLHKEIREDLDEGDHEEISFTFSVPQGLTDGLYNLQLDADYDYDRGEYDQSSDDPTDFTVRLVGCTASPPGNNPPTGRFVGISAVLDSDAKAGEPMLVRATITNLGSETGNFIISTSGYESWAELDSISKRILNLNAEESEEITMSFNIDSDASGQKSFDLEVRSGNEIETREIAVNIAKGSTTPPAFDFGDNSLLWIIGIINVVLIVLIIIVAIRISRR